MVARIASDMGLECQRFRAKKALHKPHDPQNDQAGLLL